MKTKSFRHVVKAIGPRTLKKKCRKSEEQFLSFMGSLYEATGAQRVTGMVMLAAEGIVGVCDAEHICYDPFWILCKPSNPWGIQDRDIVSVYGLRDSNGDFYKVADVFIHKPGSVIYETVMSL